MVALEALGRVITDGVMIFFALLGAYFLRMQYYEVTFFNVLHKITFFPPPGTLFPYDTFFDFSIQFTIFLLLVFAVQGRYRFGADEKFLNESIHVFWSFSAGMALLLVYFFFAKFHFFSRLIFGLAWVLGLVFLWIGRAFLRVLKHKLQVHGFGKERIILVGNGSIAADVLKPHQKPTPHFKY